MKIHKPEGLLKSEGCLREDYFCDGYQQTRLFPFEGARGATSHSEGMKMKQGFTPGALIRAAGSKGSAFGSVSDYSRWRGTPAGYAGEGLYYIELSPEGKGDPVIVEDMFNRDRASAIYIVHEDNIELCEKEATVPKKKRDPNTELLVAWDYSDVPEDEHERPRTTCAATHLEATVAHAIGEGADPSSITVWRRTNYKVVERTPWEIVEEE